MSSLFNKLSSQTSQRLTKMRHSVSEQTKAALSARDPPARAPAPAPVPAERAALDAERGEADDGAVAELLRDGAAGATRAAASGRD